MSQKGMVNTVIEHEHGLLSPEEINALENFDRLHCEQISWNPCPRS